MVKRFLVKGGVTMAESSDNRRSNKNNQFPIVPFGGGLLGKMDEFFSSEPHRGILESIDAFFQNHPYASGFPVDLYETDTEWVVKADIPGARKEDIHIETLGDRLRIAIIRDEQTEEHNDYNYFRRERRMQRSERIVQLPYSVYKQKTKARYKNGILEVRGPKYPKTGNTLDIE
jgi:HSP20 family protein